jgi:hypothetical protein
MSLRISIVGMWSRTKDYMAMVQCMVANVTRQKAICTLLSLAGLFGASVNALADPIRIESGTYGENCGAHHGNSTRDLALHCNLADTCRYPVALPAALRTRNACKADFVVEWSCGPGEFYQAVVRSAANYGGILVLTCIPSTGAGK